MGTVKPMKPTGKQEEPWVVSAFNPPTKESEPMPLEEKNNTKVPPVALSKEDQELLGNQ